MTTVWFDKIKTCVGWNGTDQAQVSELCRSLDTDLDGIIETLGESLARCKGTQPLMVNERFVQRLHGVLREWLEGLLEGAFDETYVQARWTFVRRLVEAGLTFDDVILMETMMRRRLVELAQGRLDEGPGALWATMRALDKALCLDMTLIYNGFVQVRDAEIERSLLDRFLAITGFSRTLYENLAEAHEWSDVALEQARVV